MMRRLTASLLALLLLAAPALAVVSKAPIRDATAQLSQQTISEGAELIAQVQKDTGIKLVVEFRHFLGGADVASMARELLKAEQDSEHTLLLLAAMGEDSYALAAGKDAQALLNRDAQDNLLSMSFRQPFLSRQYDQAIAGYIRQAGNRLLAALGKPGTMGALPSPAPATQAPKGSHVITFPINIGEARPTARTAEEVKHQETQKEKPLSFFSVVAISFVLYSIFGKKKGRGGSGCGPLGWILGGLGLSRIFGWRR